MNTFEETQQIKVAYACDGKRGQCCLDFSSSVFIGWSWVHLDITSDRIMYYIRGSV